MTSDERLDFDLREIKRSFKKASQKRFKRYSNGYRADRWMFQAGMVLIFAWLFFVAYWYHFDINYYKCEHGAGRSEYVMAGDQQIEIKSFESDLCRNPFYKPSLEWRTHEYLPPGEYGTKPGPMFDSTFYVPILIIAILIGLNHVIYNRRRSR